MFPMSSKLPGTSVIPGNFQFNSAPLLNHKKFMNESTITTGNSEKQGSLKMENLPACGTSPFGLGPFKVFRL